MDYSLGIWSPIQTWECGWRLSSSPAMAGLGLKETVILRAGQDVCALRDPGSFIYRAHSAPAAAVWTEPMRQACLSQPCPSNPDPWSPCSASTWPQQPLAWCSSLRSSFWFWNTELSSVLILSNTHEWATEFLFVVIKKVLKIDSGDGSTTVWM